MNPILICNNLVKRYSYQQALGGVNLTLERGRIIGLLGPNGSGKTTLIKLASGLLVPTGGEILVGGMAPGVETKKIVSYLPERTYLNTWMRVSDLLNFFEDFYKDFDKVKAYEMLQRLNINPADRLKNMSKGTKEKVQLVLVMSRRAHLYLLDEPIGGVDPAARDYILNTILKNFEEDSSILISTHLIQDVEAVFDRALFLNQGKIVIDGEVDEIREKYGKSIDGLFREVFKC